MCRCLRAVFLADAEECDMVVDEGKIHYDGRGVLGGDFVALHLEFYFSGSRRREHDGSRG